MLHHGNTPSSAAVTSTAYLIGQDGMLNAHRLRQRQAQCYTSSPIILFITPVLRCVLAMCGTVHFPTLSLSLMYQRKAGTADFSDHQ